MDRLTKKIGLVLISSSLVMYGCARHEDEAADRDDGLCGKDSGALSGSNSSNSFSHHHSYVPGFHHLFSNSHPGTNSFSSPSGSSHGGSSRGGFGGAAHGGGS